MSPNTADEPSPAVLTAWLLPIPLLLQACMNLGHLPLHQNWHIGWLLSVVALIQGLCLWRGVVVGTLTWLVVESVVLVWVNVVISDVPPPEYTGASRFNEGMVWMWFLLVGVMGGGMLAPLAEALARGVARRDARDAARRKHPAEPGEPPARKE